MLLWSALFSKKYEVSHPEFLKLQSKELPSEFDLSAKAKGNFTADSFYFDVYVKDDHITNQDRIDIWFGSPWTDFSDYIVGEKNKRLLFFEILPKVVTKPTFNALFKMPITRKENLKMRNLA